MLKYFLFLLILISYTYSAIVFCYYDGLPYFYLRNLFCMIMSLCLSMMLIVGIGELTERRLKEMHRMIEDVKKGNHEEIERAKSEFNQLIRGIMLGRAISTEPVKRLRKNAIPEGGR